MYIINRDVKLCFHCFFNKKYNNCSCHVIWGSVFVWLCWRASTHSFCRVLRVHFTHFEYIGDVYADSEYNLFASWLISYFTQKNVSLWVDFVLLKFLSKLYSHYMSQFYTLFGVTVGASFYSIFWVNSTQH